MARDITRRIRASVLGGARRVPRPESVCVRARQRNPVTRRPLSGPRAHQFAT